MIRKSLITLIAIYQNTLSPDHSPLKHLYPYGFCRHVPSCSQYAKEAIEQKGVIMGALLAARRVLSCTPWKKPDQEKVRQVLGI
jgi:putative membrane protein insertion efficiency factor